MDIINPFDRKLVKVETEFCNRPLSLEVNRLAFRSKAAVLVTYGQTVVLATVNVGGINTELDYFPFSVDYEERFYAAGKISGSRYVKREGRPSDDAVLIGRLIDRPLRPLFPKGYRCEIQAVATVLSLDPQVRPDAVALLGVSAALSLTGVPFAGPVGGVRIGQIKNQLIVYPSLDEQSNSSLDLMVASNKNGIMMVEAGGQEIDEDVVAQALDKGHEYNQQLINLQDELINKIKPSAQTYELVLPTQTIQDEVKEYALKKLETVLTGNYAQRLEKIQTLEDEFKLHFCQKIGEDKWAELKNLYNEALQLLIDQQVRQKIIKTQTRLDGRRLDEVRTLSSQVGLLPRTHGSALFTRGATQALNIVTLASSSFAQVLDTMEKDEEKYYFHHYNAPGYTLGEIKRLGSPGRREIGHSYLAERALLPVIPSQEDFPYTIRSVTEIMSQQGSTSMAATCSSCLALMDAGVPLKAPVSGIAMGLILDKDKPIFLTDIADAEDFAGDMDFKVAGTISGITALQMDMKVAGLPPKILGQALMAAKTGRAAILKHMLSVLPRPRANLSPFAPRVATINIDPHKIRDVIGKGGETIHALTAQTGAQIDIKDDGRILIFCTDSVCLTTTLQQIKDLTQDPEVGRIYHDRPVVKIADFGIFVNLSPNQDGMVHVSELADRHIRHPSDLYKEGDKVDVKLIAIDDQGRLSLSIKRLKAKV